MVSRQANTKYAVILPFLLSFYLVFRVYAINLAEVGISEFLVVFLFYLAFCLVIYLPIRLVLRDDIKASLLTTAVVFLNATYGLFKFLGWGLGLHFINRRLMFIVTAIMVVVIAFVIIRGKNLLSGLKFTYFFVLTLLAFSLIIFFSNVFSPALPIKINTLDKDLIGIGKTNVSISPEGKRDVYFIIIDNYLGHKQLKECFNYDNSKFIFELRKRGFYVPEDSRCNYPWTSLSLATTLNMNYLPDSIITTPELRHLLWNNRVLELFSRLGYTTNTVTLGKYSPPMKYVDHQYRTLLSQFVEEIMMQTYTGEIARRTFLKVNAAERTLITFDILHSIVNRDDNDIAFTYAHLLTTHGPFIFTPNGELHDNVSPEWQPKEYSDRYFDQIEFVNKKLLALVDNMLQREPRPVIILQSDHGRLIDTNKIESIDHLISILNAIYFPDGDYSLLYDTITSINTFPVFLKKYLDTSVELKEDKSYFITKDKRRYKFQITDISNIR